MQTTIMPKILLSTCLILICVIISAQSYNNFIPRPVQITPGAGEFVLSADVSIAADKSAKESAHYLQQKLEASTGLKLPIAVSTNQKKSISLVINPNLDIIAEGYTLAVTENGVSIVGKDGDGLFYGIQTLLQLLPAQVYASQLQSGIKWAIPAISINDYPRFHYRGMMLDVSRQFFDVQTVKAYIDWLSMHKMNRFHWHLSDDQGWRIEIKKYPKLTTVGAWRGPHEALPPSYGSGDTRFGGFYTQKQIKDVVRYAAERHVDIIPEIDLPGHSRAAGVAYPEILCATDKQDMDQSAQGERLNVWCVGREKNYKMLEDILKEMSTLFPSKIMNIGGDEVNLSIWRNCPVCSAFMTKEHMTRPEELQNYFVRRLEKTIHKLGKQMAGWDEINDGGDLDKSTQVNAWRSIQKVLESTSKGQPTVIMIAQNYYFDMAQSKYERGHNWAGITPLDKVYALDPNNKNVFTPEQNKFIQGIQGGIWAELLNEPARFLEYQSYPRICALAEAGWTSQSNRKWEDFYQRLTSTHFERMYSMGIAFRVPLPFPLYKNGIITVKLPYPEAEVRYTSDGNEPTKESKLYQSPISEFNYTKLKFRTFFKQLASATMIPECDEVGTWKTDSSAKPLLQEWYLAPIVDRGGIWYATFNQLNKKGVATVSQVRLYENGVLVAADDRQTTTDRSMRYRLPLIAFDNTKKYTMKALLQSADSLSGKVKMERSPYLEPTTGISVNVNLSQDNAKALIDYDFDTYVRTRDSGKAGQSLTYVFDSPLTCKRISVITGLPFTGIYPLKSGHLEVSYDGVTFIQSDKFLKGKAVITLSQTVRAIRIVVDEHNYDPMIVFQDLRIER